MKVWEEYQDRGETIRQPQRDLKNKNFLLPDIRRKISWNLNLCPCHIF